MSIAPIKTYFKSVEEEGSAFIKVAESEGKAIEVKGRILAIDAANKIKTEALAFFQKEVARVHAETEKIHAEFEAIFEAILAKLQ